VSPKPCREASAYKSAIERKSSLAGNASFKRTSGEDRRFQGVMKGMGFSSLKVGDLSAA